AGRGWCVREGYRRRTGADVGNHLRTDQESKRARHAERLRADGEVHGRKTDRTRVARGADAVPRTDADPASGRRKSDRSDACGVPPEMTARPEIISGTLSIVS